MTLDHAEEHDLDPDEMVCVTTQTIGGSGGAFHPVSMGGENCSALKQAGRVVKKRLRQIGTSYDLCTKCSGESQRGQADADWSLYNAAVKWGDDDTEADGAT